MTQLKHIILYNRPLSIWPERTFDSICFAAVSIDSSTPRRRSNLGHRHRLAADVSILQLQQLPLLKSDNRKVKI